MSRQPLTPSEFDAVCRELERRCPWIWQTSGYRSMKHNEDVRGHPDSKHRLGMARDYGAEDQSALDQAGQHARELGLWVKIHNVGSGEHVHVQGLEPGVPPSWWLSKY